MESPSRALSRLHLQNKTDMEKTNDRISQLPDAILHYILSMMPMKFFIRTSILSRRWRYLWKPVWAYSTSLDFGAEFTARKPTKEVTAAVNRYLQLHKAKEIRMFRLFLLLFSRDLLDAEKWVEFAVAKGVKELHIIIGGLFTCDERPIWIFNNPIFLGDQRFDLPIWKLLKYIFNCDSLTHLNLSGCSFKPPLNFKGCTYLKTLHLSLVKIRNAEFENILLNFPLLEELSLSDCVGLTHLKVSAPNLPLKRLTMVDCYNAREILIFAPNLLSFHFYGDFTVMHFQNISSLVDVLINGICRDGTLNDVWMSVLHHLEHVKILTLCNGSLKNVKLAEEDRPEDLPITFHKLQELQLLMDCFRESYLPNTFSFFKNCEFPCLEKLFIQLPYDVTELSKPSVPSVRINRFKGLTAEETPEIVFGNLKVIKMNDFRGLKDEMQLVKFFLEKAIVLESLILVAPQKADGKRSPSGFKFTYAPFGILHKQLLILANASSSNARILLCEYLDDNGALVPTHTEIYRKGRFRNGRLVPYEDLGWFL